MKHLYCNSVLSSFLANCQNSLLDHRRSGKEFHEVGPAIEKAQHQKFSYVSSRETHRRQCYCTVFTTFHCHCLSAHSIPLSISTFTMPIITINIRFFHASK